MLTRPLVVLSLVAMLGVDASPAAALILCRTRAGTVKARDACKPRETILDPAAVGAWRSAPIRADLQRRYLQQSTFSTTFAFSPSCDLAAGEVVTGGGCNCDTVGVLKESRASGAGWTCVCEPADTIIAEVICTKVRVAVCGNGVVEGPEEQCDGADVSGCGPGAFTCSSSCSCKPVGATRCCQGGGPVAPFCFDAASADAAAACTFISALVPSATLAPEGQLCDAAAGGCGTERRPGVLCCQCPAPSPPVSRPQFCLDFAPGAEIDCPAFGCTTFFGAQCGPTSGMCGGP